MNKGNIMKKGIHPEYNTIKVIKTNGETFETKSCLFAKTKEYYLDMRKFEKQYPGLENLK